MSCGFDKSLIAAHYDGETTPGERAEVERHLAGCPECARDLASMKDLSAALKPLGRAPAPMSIAEGVMRAIQPPPSRRPWVHWGFAAAAALFLGALTFYVVDGGTLKSPDESLAIAARKPAASDLERETSRDDAVALRKMPAAEHVEAPPLPSAPAPAGAAAAPSAEPEAPLLDTAGGQKKNEENSRMAARMRASVPVVRVTSTDAAAARALVEEFLKERKLKVAPGAPLLGRSALIRDHYLQVELTEPESALLEKRLAELKDTSLAKVTLEDEKKRVAEKLAKDKAVQLAAPADEEAAKESEKDADALNEHTRGFIGPARRKIIFVFEPAPARK
jgi:hypothetical protein